MMEEYEVDISIPPSEENSSTIKVSGAPANDARAELGLSAKVKKLKAEREDTVSQMLSTTFFLTEHSLMRN